MLLTNKRLYTKAFNRSQLCEHFTTETGLLACSLSCQCVTLYTVILCIATQSTTYLFTLLLFSPSPSFRLGICYALTSCMLLFSAPGSGPMFRSTTVAVETVNPTRPDCLQNGTTRRTSSSQTGKTALTNGLMPWVTIHSPPTLLCVIEKCTPAHQFTIPHTLYVIYQHKYHFLLMIKQ